MNEISISEFKAKCLGLIDEVQKTRQPLRITRRGKPVAEVIPAGPDHTRKFVGDLVGTGKIVGDIVGQFSMLRTWRRTGIEASSRYAYLALEQVGAEALGTAGEQRTFQREQ
jgi:prevent-host-death family protein